MKVAVVSGGPSAEAEVSRASARGVSHALAAAGHDVVSLELEPNIGAELLGRPVDVAFPVVHGAFGEDGCLQGLLEILGIPYVGSGVLASALAMCKPVAKKLFLSEGLPVADGLALTIPSPSTAGDAAAAARTARARLGDALVVKPASGGSALSVARFSSASEEELAQALEQVWSVDEVALVERFVVGREVTCSVLDLDDGPRALAATEIESPSDAFYTYEARYAPGRSVHVCPARLGEAMTARVHEASIRAHVALGCRDLSRVDFVVTDDGLTLLEVNTLPGFTPTSLYPEAARAAGLPFPDLCDQLVSRALRRGPARRNKPVPLPR